MTVTVYVKPPGPPCVQCDMTKKALDRQGTPYKTALLTGANLEAAKDLGHMSAPVVVVERADTTESWSGFRPDKIKSLL